MSKVISASIRALVVFTFLCGIIYPLCMTAIAQTLFRKQAMGSLVQTNSGTVGSALLAQSFQKSSYFWPRPSAADFATIPSGASNQGFTSKKLQDAVNDLIQHWKQGNDAQIPSDLIFASASGLDPHISPEASSFQVPRVAKARGLKEAILQNIVNQFMEKPQWGVFGEPRVNVLLLNQALDNMAPTRE